MTDQGAVLEEWPNQPVSLTWNIFFGEATTVLWAVLGFSRRMPSFFSLSSFFVEAATLSFPPAGAHDLIDPLFLLALSDRSGLVTCSGDLTYSTRFLKMVFIDLIFGLFVATAVSYVFFYFIMPRPSAILKELAGNRLRIEFVDPPAPTTPLQKIWANILVRLVTFAISVFELQFLPVEQIASNITLIQCYRKFILNNTIAPSR
jgi:hypothetical protein